VIGRSRGRPGGRSRARRSIRLEQGYGFAVLGKVCPGLVIALLRREHQFGPAGGIERRGRRRTNENGALLPARKSEGSAPPTGNLKNTFRRRPADIIRAAHPLGVAGNRVART